MNKKIFLQTVVMCAVLALRLASSHGGPQPQGSIVQREVDPDAGGETRYTPTGEVGQVAGDSTCETIGGFDVTFQFSNRFRGNLYRIAENGVFLHEIKMQLAFAGTANFWISVYKKQLDGSYVEADINGASPELGYIFIGNAKGLGVNTAAFYGSGPINNGQGFELTPGDYAIGFAWAGETIRYGRDSSNYPQPMIVGSTLASISRDVLAGEPPLPSTLPSLAEFPGGAYSMQLCFAGDPEGKCCFEDGQGSMQCANLTESQCIAAGDPHLWEEGRFCGQDGVSCPLAACIGVTASCMVPHPTPGCNHPYCCTEVCTSHGVIGAFCCDTAWDSACADLAEFDCQFPPANDECAPGAGLNDFGAITVPVPGSATENNTRATISAGDPGFCCHSGVSSCIGGTNDGLPCVVAADCPSGSCPTPSPMPGDLGYGSIWFNFILPPGQTSVGINTCTSNAPALDSILQVFRATDHSSPQSACASLVPIACNDDATNCGSTNRNSRICLEGLTPGETYYIVVAAKTPNYLGRYRVNLSTSCTSGDFSCPVYGSCCDTNGADQGCTDDVNQAMCTGPDKDWTENGLCADQECSCIPDCDGATCGDDGCGGSCGTCDDGNPCNGVETCGPNRTCVAGTPLNCNDGNYCNGFETCNPATGCLPRNPVNCDDGLFCNGAESCDPQDGCVAGDAPCDPEEEHCDEAARECVPNAIPTVSVWGLIVLTLILLAGAKIAFRRVRA